MSSTWSRLACLLILSGVCLAQIDNPGGGGGLPAGCTGTPANGLTCPAGFYGTAQPQNGTAVAWEAVKWNGTAWVIATNADVSDPTMVAVDANGLTASVLYPIAPGSQVTLVSADAVTSGHYILLKSTGGAGTSGQFTDSATCTAGQRFFGTWAFTGAAGTRLANYMPGMCSATSAGTAASIGLDQAASSTVSNGTTYYIGREAVDTNNTTHLNFVTAPMPIAGTVTNVCIQAYFSTAQANNITTWTLQKNGADTAMTGTYDNSAQNSAASCDSTAGHAFAAAQGDKIGLKVVLSGGTVAAGVRYYWRAYYTVP